MKIQAPIKKTVQPVVATADGKLLPKDFASSQEVRWCPGCGDYSILKQMQTILPDIGVDKKDIVFISGIGCSSRFPYYLDTFGMHSIHGRATAIASGLKTTRPELSIWVVTGDGDGLSIGGNHMAHLLRRNLDLNVLLFNNEIYGLTKGQYSPTSKTGIITKTTPYGSIDRPFSLGSLVLGAQGTFFARTVDSDMRHMEEMFIRASNHRGTSVVEVLQNCVIFNDKVHDKIKNRLTKDEYSIKLEHEKPLLFGANKGIILKDLMPLEVTIGENNITEDMILKHDERSPTTLSYLLASMDKPLPLGVLRAIEAPVYNEELKKQERDIIARDGELDLKDLFTSGDVWEVK